MSLFFIFHYSWENEIMIISSESAEKHKKIGYYREKIHCGWLCSVWFRLVRLTLNFFIPAATLSNTVHLYCI